MATPMDVPSGARELEAHLERDLGETATELPEDALRRLADLDELVSRWDRAVGLTGFRSRDERHRRYFAEALAALPWMPRGGNAVDLGSGGGSPALPLAVARPALSWTLVESNERKCLFLEEAIAALGLERVDVRRGRSEEVTFTEVDAVTVRGMSLGERGLRTAMAWLGPSGRLLWFSSERRLKEARARVSGRTEGPLRLVEGGGWLLVVKPDPGAGQGPVLFHVKQ